MVSHDLKEPLRKIQLLNDTIRERFLKDNDYATPYLERSIRSAARMSNLIDDLLIYARESTTEAFHLTDLNTLLDELLLDFEDVIQQKKAQVTVEPLPKVETIPTRMRQVFQNLISNALKFARDGVAPVITIRGERIAAREIDAQADPLGPFCRIVVQDNGIGFDEKFLDRIFVIFQRLHNRNTYEGTGIGLAIAKKNMEKHHGLIWARSQVGEGTRFILILPVQQAESRPDVVR